MKIIALLMVLLFSGCSTFYKDFSHYKEETIESARTNNSAIAETVDNLDGTEPDLKEELDLIKVLSRENEALLGYPSKPLDVASLVSNNQEIRLKAWKFLEAKKKKDLDNLRKMRLNEAELIKLGKIKETENNRNIWTKLVASFGFFGAIGALVGLAILCPPAFMLVMKILSSLVGWMISKIPSLINTVGVVSASFAENVVHGFENMKEETNSKDTFTKEEVLEMIKKNMAISMDKSDKQVVDEIKKKYNL